MQTRRLGETAIHVSPLGLGTVKWGRNEGVKYPQSFSLPSDEVLIELLAICREFGVNLIDTAPAYGMSELRLGELLHPSEDWVICTKVGESFEAGISAFDFSQHAITDSIERSLKRLKRDTLDIVLVHSDGRDDAIIEADQVFDTLNRLKSQGKIRSFGMSTKTVSGGLHTVANADCAMVTYHPGETTDQVIIEAAHHTHKGILIKKAFASGHFQNQNLQYSVEDAMRFIFAQAGVTSVIVGTINPLHLKENIAAVLKQV